MLQSDWLTAVVFYGKDPARGKDRKAKTPLEDSQHKLWAQRGLEPGDLWEKRNKILSMLAIDGENSLLPPHDVFLVYVPYFNVRYSMVIADAEKTQTVVWPARPKPYCRTGTDNRFNCEDPYFIAFIKLLVRISV